ncbi:MAG: hypothetical protein PVJ60_02260, partial [Phycisphaerales bacterium]
LTEPEAWLEIANAYITPPSKRTKLQIKITRVGICRAATELAEHKMISKYISYQRIYRPCMAQTVGGNWYLCRLNRRGDHLRAYFCLLMYYVTGGE